MLWLFVKLLIGLVLILLGANWLVDGSSSIARKSGISEFVIGLTIVGIGTSTPEMVVSFISSIQGNSDIAVGNIVGSNIANTFLILGVVSMVAPIPLTKSNIRYDIPITLLATILFFVLGSDIIFRGAQQNTLSRVDGAIFFVCFILFMVHSFHSSKKVQLLNQSDTSQIEVTEDNPPKMYNTWASILMVVVGLGGLIFGGRLFVGAGSAMASAFGLSDAFIGITIMAIGTSLPELAASLVAAIKKRGQLALGNILGSNVANILLILGGSSLIMPLTMTSITIVDMSVLLFTSIAVFFCAYSFKKKVLDRWEGLVFVLIYAAYMTWLIYQL